MLRKVVYPKQSWLRAGIFSGSHPETWFWGFYIGILNFEQERKISEISAEIPKSRGWESGFENPGDRDRDMKISKKSRPENTENSKIPGVGIYCKILGIRDFFEIFTFAMSSGYFIGLFSWDGISQQKASSDQFLN